MAAETASARPTARGIEAVALRERARVADEDHGDVHVHALVLEVEEMSVERRQPFVVGLRHASTRGTRRARSQGRSVSPVAAATPRFSRVGLRSLGGRW